MFWYGHPFIAQGAGRIKTDPLNQQRVEKVLSRFEQWAGKNNALQNFNYSITKTQVQRSKIAFPIAGFAIGVLGSTTFVHKNSRYIGKFFTLLTTYIGYKVHQNYEHAYNVSRRMGNFALYPKQIRMMLENNDSRYAFRWLNDNYLDIPSGNQQTKTEEGQAQEAEE